MVNAHSKRLFTITSADWGLLIVAIVWGSSYPAVKFVLDYSDVMTIIFIRFSLTAVFMFPVFMKSVRGQVKETLGVGGILGGVLFLIFLCETAGVQRTTAVNAAFFISLCVLFTPLLDSLVTRKIPKLGLILACILTCIGAGLMGINSDYHFKLVEGDLLILMAAFLRAAGVVITKQLMQGKRLDSGAVTFVQMLMVSLISGSWLWVSGHGLMIPSDANFWLVTLYLAVFCTLLAFYLQTHMVRKTSPTHVILIMGTEPIFGALFAIILLQENLTLIQVSGGAFIVIATYWGVMLQKQEHSRTAPIAPAIHSEK